MCAGGKVLDEPDGSLLRFDEWLDVGFTGVVCSPDADITDEVGVDVAVVELGHGFEWE